MHTGDATSVAATATYASQHLSQKPNSSGKIPSPLELKTFNYTQEPSLSGTISYQPANAIKNAEMSPPSFLPTPTSAGSPSSMSSIPNGTSNPASNRISRKRSPADFRFLECIGEGSYSNVYKAVSKSTGHTYAIKVLNKQHIHKEKKRKYVTIEKNTLNMLGKHPGIVTLYYTFQDPKSLYFVIDYASNGEFLGLIHQLGTLSLELSHYYTVQLIDTIAFIHNKGIIHRDLKPENILLSKGWKLMITDFGAAKIVDVNKNNLGSQSSTPNSANSECANAEHEDEGDDPTENEESNSGGGSFVGTAEYISPELLKYNQSSFASDFWSLGCIIYQMIVGRPPFKANNEYETFERIVDVVYSFPDPNEYPIPSCVVEVIKQLLFENPSERLGIESLKQQKWFSNTNWNSKDAIWGPVPKLESYKPERYFKIVKKIPPQSQTQVNVRPLKATSSRAAQPSYVSSPVKKNVPLKTATPKHVHKPIIPQKISVDNDKPGAVLKKQLLNAQSNTDLMNKVLTNRIDEKNPTISKKLVNSRIQTSPGTSNVKPIKQLSNQQKPLPTPEKPSDPLAGLQVNQKRLSKTPASSPKLQQRPTLEKRVTQSSAEVKSNRKSQASLSSMFTSGDSSKSVIITSKATAASTVPIATTVPTATSAQISKPVSEKTNNGVKPNLNTSSSISNTKQANGSSLQKSKNKQFIPKSRVVSSDAAAAAGAIGTLLTHNRNLNSVSSTIIQHKQLKNHQKQLINPVLLDKQIPSVITSKLMQHETILKLDNIFKSELSHKPNQFTSSGETLNHTILEDIVYRYERDLEKDFKACIMVITSFARLFIYEINDDFRLNNPQSSTMMQAQDFYLKIVEIKLTNKNVSLYDYEFDEEMHEGFLILELSNLNKLIFLSAWDRSRFIKGGLNSNVRVGFHVNDNETWVKSFMNAKNLLKRRELRAQSNLNKPRTRVGSSTLKNNKPGYVSENVKPNSGSGVQQTLRNLKSNTSNRIRSLSTSSGNKEKERGELKISVHASPISTENSSSPNSTHGSLLNGMKELALGVKTGFKSKDNQQLPMTVNTAIAEKDGGSINGYEKQGKVENGFTNEITTSNDKLKDADRGNAVLTNAQRSQRVVRRKSMQVISGNSNPEPNGHGSRAAMAAALAVGRRK